MTLLDPVLETVVLMQPGAERDLLGTLLRRPAWMAEGACTDEPTERFFASAATKPAAWALDACRRCTVEPPAWSSPWSTTRWALWGGTTDRDRMRLLRQESTTWVELSSDRRSALLEAAVTHRDPVQPSTACEHCDEPASRRYCSPRCRSSASSHRRRAAPCEFCEGVTPK